MAGGSKMRSSQRDEHLALPAAAALVYRGINGTELASRDLQAMQKTLDDIALAMSMVVPIYSPATLGATPVVLSTQALSGARFRRGARVLITAGNEEHFGLTVQRKDIDEAIALLKPAAPKS